jgi:hypothetical protein
VLSFVTFFSLVVLVGFIYPVIAFRIAFCALLRIGTFIAGFISFIMILTLIIGIFVRRIGRFGCRINLFPTNC